MPCRSAACVSACVCCLCCRPACRRAFSLPAVLPCRVPPLCVSCRLRAAASALLSCLPPFLPCLPALLLPACCFAACRFVLPCRVPLSFVRFRYSPKARRVPALPLFLPSAALLCCVWCLCTFVPLRVLCRPFCASACRACAAASLPAVPASFRGLPPASLLRCVSVPAAAFVSLRLIPAAAAFACAASLPAAAPACCSAPRLRLH